MPKLWHGRSMRLLPGWFASLFDGSSEGNGHSTASRRCGAKNHVFSKLHVLFLFVLFCDAPCPRFSAAISAVAMFIAARIRISCSMNPQVVIFHITTLQCDSKRRISNQGNLCTKWSASIPPNKMSLLAQAP